MALQFMNCLKLNCQAREFILHSDCAYAILPGEEFPAYFTHRVDGNFLTVGGSDTKYFSCKTNIHSKTNHLIIFGLEFSLDGFSDPPAGLNSSDVQFEFFCLDHKKKMIQIKEGGIQLLEESPSLDDIWESFERSGENDAEARRSRKQMHNLKNSSRTSGLEYPFQDLVRSRRRF
ncbi:unnamed protein product [Thlaspi arvense]|uniref:Uncharacterized protein n=1 Tax=Thlaspi arvense TaxID=13288 RepID=A0AAU9RNE0_THLAR|nr:unnamed protein product [Thlaspi arvense]